MSETVTFYDPDRVTFIEELETLLAEVKADQDPSNVSLFEAVFAALRVQARAYQMAVVRPGEDRQ